MIVASSPAKIILCGEHYVVYGAPAVALPVDRRNSVELEVIGNEGKLLLESDVGKATIYGNGDFKGEKILEFCKPIYLKLAGDRKETFRARIIFGGAPKGMGNSASIASAMAIAFSRYVNSEMTVDKLFEITQIAENVAHGGKASGIDARTVIAGEAQLFRKTFNPTEFNFKNMKLELPKDTAIVAISTYKDAREGTSQLIERFAMANKIKKKPEELTEKEREELLGSYKSVFNEILNELRIDGNPERLGRLLSKNHELLRNSNVSTEEIDKAIKLAVQNGAYGGKLTGAGGKGGACFALANKKNVDRIVNALNTEGYLAFVANLAKNGARVDRN
ncbi:hypothetical protein HY570_00290 [Candidatus Micrarchaeota archaeon]|nr:hypothetical protein [Candidatus Micrarchaeota archaeon]